MICTYLSICCPFQPAAKKRRLNTIIISLIFVAFWLFLAAVIVEPRNLLVHFSCGRLSLAFIGASKCSYEQIWTLGWAFMHRNTNVRASQGLHRATEPWTKMSAPINNNAGSSMLDPNICTSSCIFRRSTWEVYLCEGILLSSWLWPSEWFCSHGINKPLSVCLG